MRQAALRLCGRSAQTHLLCGHVPIAQRAGVRLGWGWGGKRNIGEYR